MAKSRSSSSRSEHEIGFVGIESLFLQLVGAQFVGDADAPAFLVKIDEDAAAGFVDFFEVRA